MKILLAAVNAKYIHSNPAVYSLCACVEEALMPYVEIAEYTINNKKEEILASLYREKPSMIAFSCYIWNWDMIKSLLAELPKILPETVLWLGGPEVSYNAEEVLKKHPMVTGVMVGEGEETFRELVNYYYEDVMQQMPQPQTLSEKMPRTQTVPEQTVLLQDKPLEEIKGIVYCTRNGEICHTPERELTNLSKLPFLYDNLQLFENRIIYYESSRGCPYRCSYCLSSIDKKVRLRDIAIVKKELQFFLAHNVKQVKFVDRTFNCNHEHAKEIWRYIAEHDNGITNFHFEIAADLITEEELEILAKFRPGLAQMEIGVQTVNSETLQEIRRITDLDKLRSVVKRIREGNNIHIHLDLIAGLPFEDYKSFIHSFNSVYDMHPQQLQLGFLKVLKGSYLYEKAGNYKIQYTDAPPYEVLSTKWISFAELLLLKQAEEMLELYYNSGQFIHALPVLQSVFPDAFTMYLHLAEFYRAHGYLTMTPSRIYRYQVLLDYAMETELAKQEEMFRQVLTFDLYLRENSKSRPDFARDLTPYKTEIRNFYQNEEKTRYYLPSYIDYDSRQLAKMTHIELFDYPVWEEDVTKAAKRLDKPVMVLFHYDKRDVLTYEAEYRIII